MKWLLCLFALVVAALTFAQEPVPTATPAEVKLADFMIGDWVNYETLVDGDKKFDVTYKLSISKALGDRYLLVRHGHNAPGEPDTEGLHMLTYDPDRKMWRAWWFLSTENAATELSGNFEGDKLVMISNAFQMPGMSGDLKWRASWNAPSKDRLVFKLELNQADTWNTFIDRTYTRR